MNFHSPSLDSRKRIGQYLRECGRHLKLKRCLGGGTDGDVWESNRKTAIKVLQHEGGYYNERDAYLRLKEFGVTNRLGKFWVPQMMQYSDELRIVEMDMMQEPPYVIDFAKIKFNDPEFPDNVVEDFHKKGRENFEHNWPAVLALLDDLESFQIYYLDPNRGNITFPDMQ